MLKRSLLVARNRINTYRPDHLQIIARDAVGVRVRPCRADRHLDAAMEWLCRAQDVTGCGGVSAGYYFDDGWRGPYPETTGYIIPTFLTYARLRDNETFVKRAVRMGDWESEIQMPCGAVRGGVGVNDFPIVFNTGQVVLGWSALFRRTREQRFADSVARACDWLVSTQESGGEWRRHTYLDIPHAYHTRVAWALLEGFGIVGNAAYRAAAERQVLCALSKARPNGWIDGMGFDEDEAPPTHTIAYTLRGLFECGLRLENETGQKSLALVERVVTRLMRRYELRKQNPYDMPFFLAGQLDERLRPAAAYSCLTGDCQFAILWLKLYRRNGDARLLNAALKILDQVAATQPLRALHPGIRGGVAGSYPLWGSYIPYGYPNWSAKFFADALMLQEETMRPLESLQ